MTAKLAQPRRILIIEPIEFIRCGYPMDVGEVADKLIGDPAITALLAAHGVEPGRVSDLLGYKLRAQIAYTICKAKQFGGPDRKVYRRPLEERFRGAEARVVNRFATYSGEYYPSFGGGRWNGGDYDDWEPAGLEKREAHVVYEVSTVGFGCEPFLIEKRHCEVIG